MNDDEIPVLNAIRDQLVAGIAKRGERPARWSVLALAGVAVLVLIVAGLVFVSRSGNPARRVVVHGPMSAAESTGTSSAGNGTAVATSTTTMVAPVGSAPPNTTTIPPATTPISALQLAPTTAASVTSTSVKPTPPTTIAGTINLFAADGGRKIGVTPGTTIDIDLIFDGTNCGLSWGQPASSDNGVLTLIKVSHVGASSQGEFRATAAGTAVLTSDGFPQAIYPQSACPTYGIRWSVSVTVG